MKIKVGVNVSGLLEVEVLEDRLGELERLCDEADGDEIDITDFEDAAGVEWDYDGMCNHLFFTIGDIELPPVKKDDKG
jgi:hypothetical protein